MIARHWIGYSASFLLGGALVWFLGESFRGAEEHLSPRQAAPVRVAPRSASVGTDTEIIEAETTADFEAALAEAEARNADLLADLNDVERRLAEIKGVSDRTSLPGGYNWWDGPDGMIKVFGDEQRDESWAPVVEDELFREFNQQASDRGILLAGQRIECRTYVCRVSLDHIHQPESYDELKELGDTLTTVARELIDATSSIDGATIEHRGGYPGELPVSELIFFRSAGGVTYVTAEFDTPLQGAPLFITRPDETN